MAKGTCKRHVLQKERNTEIVFNTQDRTVEEKKKKQREMDINRRTKKETTGYIFHFRKKCRC